MLNSQPRKPVWPWLIVASVVVLITLLVALYRAGALPPTPPPGAARQPKFAYPLYCQNAAKLYSVNLDGSGSTLLLPINSDWLYDYTWSPDGSQLAFLRSRASEAFYALNLGDASVTRLGELEVYIPEVDSLSVYLEHEQLHVSNAYIPVAASLSADGSRIAAAGPGGFRLLKSVSDKCRRGGWL